MNTVEHELRDLCIQLEVHAVQNFQGLSQCEAINEMLQSLKMNANTKSPDQNPDLLDDSREHQLAVSEFLTEIDQAMKIWVKSFML